ncbi:hypothetical protein VIBNISOn1_880001 [Vibrio nigripulchritudo SOn1]|uniref:Transposase n=1 Tax=Vibrio nigripulchritudo SOn1 TaxID=1238450 RepID=A0AAV2VYL3_9VIBR|nr:hypothetical protein VIBNISOn1_880001 [Vibrio nigripulchritudo SOn1]
MEEENAKLKKLLAESLLDIEALNVALNQNDDKRKAAHAMQKVTQISERRACRLVGIHLASKRYISS